MELENRKRRPRRLTLIILILNNIRIKCPSACSNRRKILPSLGRARERPCEASAIRLACGIDACVVDAEIGAEMRDQRAGEFLV